MEEFEDMLHDVPSINNQNSISTVVTASWSEDEEDLEEAEIVEEDDIIGDSEHSFVDDPEPEYRDSPTQNSSRDPLSTVTLAEIYLSQGFLAQALKIFQDLSDEDPANEELYLRIADIQARMDDELAPPVEMNIETYESPETFPEQTSFPTPVSNDLMLPPHEEILFALESCLENIERMRRCR
jgi:hypothetical protein